MNIWLQFLICTGVIVFAGAKLSKYGDIIADITGLGRTWIGVVLMATVTSLPELITGASSVVFYDLPDIAVGDALGSCMFNVGILAILDFLHKKPLTAEANARHALAGAFGIILLATAAIAMFLRDRLPSVGWIGLSSPLFVAFYFAAMRLIFIQQQRGLLQDHGDHEQSDISKRRAYTIYGLHAAIVIAAASWLPTIGDRIAQQTGLGHTFVGSLFIGLSTSLPEFVVTYTAVRRGAVNMAVGNLLGSNLFNIAILAIDDLLYTEGPLLAAVEGHHLVTACGAILVTGFAVIGLTYRSEKKYLRFGLDSLASMTAFVAVTFLLYRLRSG